MRRRAQISRQYSRPGRQKRQYTGTPCVYCTPELWLTMCISMFLHHKAEAINTWLDKWHIEALLVAFVWAAVLAIFALALDPDAVSGAFAGFIATSPIWLVIMLFVMFWRRWMHY